MEAGFNIIFIRHCKVNQKTMLKNLQEFIKVKSLDEAQNILKNKAGAAAILAGGTSLMKSGDKRINTIVDISSLE